MKKLFETIKSIYPKAVVQTEKKYVSFTFGGAVYYQLRVQKDKVRMMATNYPAKAKMEACARLIQQNTIEGREINGRKIIFEPGARNPEIFTLRLEIPCSDDELHDDVLIRDVAESAAGFHEALIPLVNHFLKKPVGDLYTLMGGRRDPDAGSLKINLPGKPAAEKLSAANSNSETELSALDVTDGSVIDYICRKIKTGRYLTHLTYVNEVLATKGYETDRHQAFFFDNSVLVSDRELEGFLMVNLDGFYSNCIDEENMQMMFSWSGVNSIQYAEDGDDCTIDLVADKGELTIKKKGNHSLKILYTLYKHVWSDINDEFRNESFIVWNKVDEMGIDVVSFPSYIDYCTFYLPEADNDNEEVPTVNADDDLPSGTSEERRNHEEAPYHVGRSYEKHYLRFLEIARKTGILTNEIQVEPDPSERDELWNQARVFAERLYEHDQNDTLKFSEVNDLCYYTIVALHWCDIYITDDRFSHTNGRFRRDTIALALCFYARMSPDYDHHEACKLKFILPHIQFSVLLWTINAMVNLQQDKLLGRITADQAREAQVLFTRIDRENQEKGGYGVVSPKKMPEDHPLKTIWNELFNLFREEKAPCQFIRDYINLPLPGLNVTLLDVDRERNTAYLDACIAMR